MSRSLNKVLLIGNVGKDPELTYTPGGVPYISFRLATSENWRDKDGILREHTDWHTIVAWRGLAEVINKMVRKGSRIFIEGKLRMRSFEDRNKNRKHVVEILADNMLLLDSKRSKSKKDDDFYSDDEESNNYEDSNSSFHENENKTDEYNDNTEQKSKDKNVDTFLF